MDSDGANPDHKAQTDASSNSHCAHAHLAHLKPRFADPHCDHPLARRRQLAPRRCRRAPLPDARLVLRQPRILQIGQAAVSAPAVPQRVHAWIMWEDGVEDLVPTAQVWARHASEVSERASATVSEYDSHARY